MVKDEYFSFWRSDLRTLMKEIKKICREQKKKNKSVDSNLINIFRNL